MKLKALRPQVGKYGSVDAGAVVEIDDPRLSSALVKGGHFVTATASDLAAARKRQQQFIEAATANPVGPRFAHTGEVSGAASDDAADAAEPDTSDDGAGKRSRAKKD